MSRHLISSFEVLEARIAPAILLVGTSDLTIKNLTTHANAVSDTTAATEAGAGFALLVKAGDSVVYDFNHNGLSDAKDVKLIGVTGGSAMAFFTDNNLSFQNTSQPNGKFDLQELTGLVVSSGAKATVIGDIHGAVAVALDSAGHFQSSGGTITFANDSLAGLTVTGHVIGGDILAGGDITNVTFKNPVGSHGTVASVSGALAAGTAAGGRTASFNGGAKTLTTAPVSSLFGSISKIKLANGARALLAGNGQNSTTAGLSGGSITDVTFTDTATGSIDILAGNGGNNTGTGLAGNGGDISKLNIHANATGAIRILAGNGGLAANGATTATAGGFGGDISTVTIVAPRDLTSFDLEAGNGGNVTSSAVGAKGGAGGSVSGLTASLGHISGGLTIYAGNGGKGINAGASGALGGSLAKINLTSGGAGGNVDIEAGIGGSAHSALAVGGAPEKGGISGFGGDVTTTSVTMTGDVGGFIGIFGGRGGDVLSGGGIAQSGGDVTKTTVNSQSAVSGLNIFAGRGGNAAQGGSGGFGGNLDTVTVVNRGTLGAAQFTGLQMGGGNGGLVGSTGGEAVNPGDGGSASSITVTNYGRLHALHATGGNGGNSSGIGAAGSGGDLKKVTIKNFGSAADASSGEVFLVGGDGGVSHGDGGLGGSVDKITYTDPVGMTPVFQAANGGSFTGVVFISAGSGGAAPATTDTGGDGGDVSNITLKAPHTVFSVGLPYAKGGDGGAGGGFGGNVSSVSGTVEAISIAAQDGGGATNTGDGGVGGSVQKLNITVSEFAQSIRAGNGGSTVDENSFGGLGGSIKTVKVVGDIGDFKSFFYVQNPGLGMGGLIAGQGGSNSGDPDLAGDNGSIADVTATRIAAILAGRPASLALSSDNAVTAISGIKANVIGADVNGDGLFAFVEGNNNEVPGVYQLPGDTGGDGDTALDGFVLVKTGKFTGIKPPIHKLIEI